MGFVAERTDIPLSWLHEILLFLFMAPHSRVLPSSKQFGGLPRFLGAFLILQLRATSSETKASPNRVAEQSGSDVLSVGGSKPAARITCHQHDASVRFIHDETIDGAERFDAQ